MAEGWGGGLGGHTFILKILKTSLLTGNVNAFIHI